MHDCARPCSYCLCATKCHLLCGCLGGPCPETGEVTAWSPPICVCGCAQSAREALALALFVECFVGEKFEREDGAKAFTGGFSLYPGDAARRCTLALLRHWAGEERVLASLSAELVGRVWLPLLTKLRRDAGLEVEKVLAPRSPKALRLEWFQLRPAQALRKRAGAFHPEELLEACLDFLRSHLRARCAAGAPAGPVDEGIAPPHPAEQWFPHMPRASSRVASPGTVRK